MQIFQEYLHANQRINIRFSGQGGQGVILLGYLFGKAAIFQGLNAVQTQKYGPESRGSPVKSDLVISKEKINFPLFKYVDFLVTMNQDSYSLNQRHLLNTGIMIIDTSMVKVYQPTPNTFGIPAMDLANKNFQNPMLTNVILLGFINHLLPNYIQEEHFIAAIKESVRKNYVKINLEAFKLGQSQENNCE